MVASKAARPRLLVALLFVTFFLPGSARAVTDVPYNWRSVKIQGGGYATGIVTHPLDSNLVYMRCDVAGFYRWDTANARWINLTDQLITDDFISENYPPTEAVAVDPNDTNKVYIGIGGWTQGNSGWILRSSDKGNTWSFWQTPFLINGNLDGRWGGERLCVDPNNSNTIYYGSRTARIYKSTDGGASFSQLTGSPAGDTTSNSKYGVQWVAADKNGTSTILYCGAKGGTDGGIYRSTNGGSSWSLISGTSGFWSNRGIVDASGTLWVVGDGVRKMARGGSSMTSVTPPNTRDYGSIGVNPQNTNEVTVATSESHGDVFYRSTNGGSSWWQLNMSHISNNPATTNGNNTSAVACIAVNPTNPNQVWYVDWYNAWRTDNITADPAVFTTRSEGYEPLVALAMSSPRTGVPLMSGGADHSMLRHTSISSVPSLVDISGNWEITGIDFCETDPNYVAIVGGKGWEGNVGNGGSTSTNNGATVTNWSNMGSGSIGLVAVGATKGGNGHATIVWLPKGFAAKRSTDGGQSWQTSNSPAAYNEFFDMHQVLASDRANGSKFYMINRAGGNLEIYRSTDGGLNWGWASSISSGAWNVCIDTTPGVDGSLWVAADGQGLWRSTNSGSTMTKISNVQWARQVTVGPPATAGGTHAVYIHGGVDNVRGVFRSDDNGASWVRVYNQLTHKTGLYRELKLLEADHQVYGRVYGATGGRGIWVGDISSNPPSTADIAAGTATIDATVESTWNNATAYTIGNVTGTISSTSDASGTFKGLWDSTNLYLLAEVTDDNKSNDSTNAWDDDSVEVYLDGNNNKTTTYDTNDRQYVFGWGDTAAVEAGGRSSTGVTFAKADPTSTTYRIELKVPWSTLGVTASSGKNIGLDVHINDDDAGGTREGKRQWNDTADTAWQNPSVFGVGTLQAGGSPPAAPTGLAATAGSGQVALSWNASSGATSYNVKRSTTSGSGYTTINSPTTTSYTNTGLTNGTTYYYVVSAVNSVGESANSSQVSATPQAPSGGTANIAAGTVTVNTTVEAAWGNATAYTIGNITGTISSTSDASGTFKGLWDSTNLYVLAEVTDDNKSNDSTDPWQDDSIEVYLDGNNDKTTSYDTNDRQYVFGWNDTAVVEAGGRSSTGVTFAKADPTSTTYRIELKVPWSTLGVTASSGKNIGLDVHINDDDAGGTREGKRQWNDTADTAWQNPSVFGVGALQAGGSPPAAPTGLAATAGNGQVALSWNASSGATSYNVKRSTTSGSGYGTIASPTTTSYTNTGLTNGVTYYYVVSAVNSNGESANSSQVSATPQASQGTFGNSGNPWSVASSGTTRIQVENFDTGGQGVAYNDTTTTNSGGQYRTSDGVDIETTTDTGGGYNIGWVSAGEWLEYTVNVASAGTYDIKLRVARSSTGTSTVRVLSNGVDKTGSMTVPSTGGWQTFTTITASGVSLSAGQQVIRIDLTGSSYNLNWIEFTAVGGGPIANGTYKIIARHSGKAMDAGAGTTNGTDVVQWTSGNYAEQRFTFEYQADGYYEIKPNHVTGMNVEVDGGGTANGTVVQIWADNNTDAQRWKVEDLGGGYWRITPKVALGSCADVAGVSYDDMAPIHIWSYGGGENQQWQILAP